MEVVPTYIYPVEVVPAEVVLVKCQMIFKLGVQSFHVRGTLYVVATPLTCCVYSSVLTHVQGLVKCASYYVAMTTARERCPSLYDNNNTDAVHAGRLLRSSL